MLDNRNVFLEQQLVVSQAATVAASNATANVPAQVSSDIANLTRDNLSLNRELSVFQAWEAGPYTLEEWGKCSDKMVTFFANGLYESLETVSGSFCQSYVESFNLIHIMDFSNVTFLISSFSAASVTSRMLVGICINFFKQRS